MSVTTLREAKQLLRQGDASAKKLLAELEQNPPTNATELAAATAKTDAIVNNTQKTKNSIRSTILKGIGAVVIAAAAAVATAATGGLAAHIAIPVAAALVERIFDKGVDAASKPTDYKSPTPFSMAPRPPGTLA